MNNGDITAHNDFPFGWLIIGLLGALVFWTTAHGQAVTPSPVRPLPSPPIVERVEPVGFTVSDMDRALDFYTRVLPFEKVSDDEFFGTEFEHLTGVFGARARVVRLKLGSETIELTEYLTGGGRPVPVDSRSNDRWFQHVAIIVSDMEKAFAVLRQNKVRFASTAPQTLPKTIPNAAGITAFYFRDPDNHVLEILHFPPDKGAKKWHDLESSGQTFLGIDHTAIVVENSDASLGFYRDLLGLTVAGTSDNFGTEQEHLNNVFGASLHITGLRTKNDGIAVEFLEYRAPKDGRPFPADTRSNDLWNWQTSFESSAVGTLLDSVIASKSRMISTGIVATDWNKFGFKRAISFRDPDGHAVRTIER